MTMLSPELIVAPPTPRPLSNPCNGPANHPGNEIELRGTSTDGPADATRTTSSVPDSRPARAQHPTSRHVCKLGRGSASLALNGARGPNGIAVSGCPAAAPAGCPAVSAADTS